MDRNMTTPAKIELWMREAVKEMMVKHLGFGASVGTNWMLLESDLVAIIAGHAPEQEWEAKEKALREALITCVQELHNPQGYEHRRAVIDNAEAILNREQEKQ